MGAESKIGDMIGDAQGWANQALVAAQSALANLGTVSVSTTYGGGYGGAGLVATDPVPFIPPEPPTPEPAPPVMPIHPKPRPTKPGAKYPSLGNLLSIRLPEPPVINFPTLNIEPPVYNIAAPQAWTFSIDNFAVITDDPLAQAVVKKLLDMIRNGGTGLSEEIEDAIWNRELERNQQQLEDSLDKARVAWAKTGFSLPDGMLANSLVEMQREYMNKRLDTAREIAIKQAELEQINLFKSLELAIQAYSKIYELITAYQELVFKSQEATARFANEYIELQLKAYQSKVDAYKAQAQTQEILIRAEMAKVELYKTELEGQKLIGEVNSQTIEVYTSLLKSINVMMDTYKAEVSAYVAELEGDKAIVESNKLQFDIWAEKAKVALQSFAGKVDLYKAESMVNISFAEVQNKVAEANMQMAISAAQVNSQHTQTIIQGLHTAEKIKMDAAKGVADAAASLAAGAMAALTAKASMSYEERKILTDD